MNHFPGKCNENLPGENEDFFNSIPQITIMNNKYKK